mmetsp:Transcript_4856/g.5662  ORF Transcript_4856/g.5662 Transcript_4856/m.5662 type:complete len:82 (+) Transcript_4856:39-284(+)
MTAHLIKNMTFDQASASDIRRARNLTLLSELYEEAAVAYNEGDKDKLRALIGTSEQLAACGSLRPPRLQSDDLATVDSMSS